MGRTEIRRWLERMSRDELLDEALWMRLFIEVLAERCNAGDCEAIMMHVIRLQGLARDMCQTLSALGPERCDACTIDRVDHPCQGECLFRRNLLELGIDV